MSEKNKTKSLIQSLGMDGRVLTMLMVLAITWIVFQLFTYTQEGSFLGAQNLFNLAVQTSVVGILVGGMVLVIVTRQIDLSVGSVLGFSAMVMGLMQAMPPFGKGLNWVLALVVGVAVGALIGAANGALVAYLNVPSFVVTLAGLLVFRNAAYLLNSGTTVSPMNKDFTILGSGSIGAFPTVALGLVAAVAVVFQVLGNRSRRTNAGLSVRPMWVEGSILALTLAGIFGFVLAMNSYADPSTGEPRGIPVPTVVALLVLGGLSWMSQNTRFGRYVFAMGGNPEAALLVGINTKRMLVYVFALMGALAGLAGAVQAARSNSVTNSMGNLLELDVIAAAVIGGTALAGGSGTIVGSALGALLMASLRAGMVLMGVRSEYQNLTLGLVLLAAAIWNTIYLKRK